MFHQDTNSREIIDGIKCDVKNCAYHREGDLCEAGCIEVGYGEACHSSETACVTFRAKG